MSGAPCFISTACLKRATCPIGSTRETRAKSWTRWARGRSRRREAEPINAPALGLVPFSDDVQPLLEDAWLIEDVLPDDGLGVGYGAPGAGKTFQILDMAFAIGGAAHAWHGRYVSHGTVLYFGMEGESVRTAWRPMPARRARLRTSTAAI